MRLEHRVDERSRRVAARFEVPVLVAALLVIPVIVIEESNVSDTWKTLGAILNWIIWVAFAVEVIVMLAVVPSKKRWLRDNPLEVAIVVLTPPFLPASLQALRVFRLFRLLRLLRIARLGRRVFSLQGLRYVALLALLTVLGGGAAFAAVEKHSSTWDGVWWAFTTATTVGYGDKYPVTVLGRAIGMTVMLVGISFIAVLTGAIAQRFLAAQVEEVVEAEETIEATEAEVLAELREVRSRLDRLEARLGRGAT
jgi:voltage-gated potassium channel